VEARRLIHSRHFCTDWLVELKDELARIQAEDLELKDNWTVPRKPRAARCDGAEGTSVVGSMN
jgi:hypothetical protein